MGLLVELNSILDEGWIMFKYFKIEDFDCQETGVNGINVKFVSKLAELRED